MAKHMRPIRVNEDTVREWAEGTLGEWLPGYTDYDEVLGSQFRIRQHDDGTYEVGTVDGFGFSTLGRFRVIVTVLEVRP